MKKKALFWTMLSAFAVLLSSCGKTERILIPGQEQVPEQYRFYYLVKTSGDKQLWGIEGVIDEYPKASKDPSKESEPPKPIKIRIAPKWEAAEVLGKWGGFRLLKDGMWHAYSLDGKPIGELPYFSKCETSIPNGYPHYDAMLKLETPDGIFMAFQDTKVLPRRGNFPVYTCFGPYQQAEFGYQGYFFKEIDEFDEGSLWGYNAFKEDSNEIFYELGPGCKSIIELADTRSYLTAYYFLVEGMNGWEIVGRKRTKPTSSYYQGCLFMDHLPIGWSLETLRGWVEQLPDGTFDNLKLNGNVYSFRGFWDAENRIGFLTNSPQKK